MIGNMFYDPSDEHTPNTSEVRKERRKRSKEEKARLEAQLKAEAAKRTRVKNYVLDCLNGFPPGYISTIVKYIENNSFRVNIRAYVTPTKEYKYHDKIVHSFIVYETPTGELYANPPIPRLYNNLNAEVEVNAN